MIKIQESSFGYSGKDKVLNKIDLKVNKGECILLCGESGCGKTTLTKLINGLIPHFTYNGELEGSVTAAGMNVETTKMYELSKKIGSVFQNPKSQFFNLDSDSELAFGLENKGIDPIVIENRLEETIHQLGIENLLNRNIFSMSGGEKQMLAFASVYAMNPEIYILDEPSANLDTESINILRKQIEKIKSQGHTIVITEHRMYFLKGLIDRAIFLKNGEIDRDFIGKDFMKMSQEERIKLGLRSFNENKINVKSVAFNEGKRGLEIKNLSCKVKKNMVFKNLSFSVMEGDIIAITGHNGAGKTTLSRCISGLLKESSGSIKLDGKVLSRRERRKLSFLVMQDVNHQLFADSVWNECEMADSNLMKKQIENVLRDFNLLSFREFHPMALSGGQKQRLAVATAILTNKKILIFDEPTSGLDYKHMIGVSNFMKKLSKSGHIILIVTHDIEFLNNTCNKFISMKINNRED
ncbi:ABC transporter ATP-binding protein [Clostridium sp. LCP25S3_F8]|uniref:ABC transporter ATP-binding protein n=1 Tax=Clostridium sp. LCP25S3_F8 TaxID=3438751 RepID=UPI003F90D6F5